jgi:hypothetical protein
MRSILQIGNDLTLLSTRAAVLRLTGASVIAASADEAIDILHREHFDLLVFCHTVSLQEREKISLAARKLNMNVRVLNVLRSSAIGLAPDETVSDPTRLVVKVTETLQNTPRAQQRPLLSASTSVWTNLLLTSKESSKRAIRR